ncbi:MAG TPA: prephenate dehydrogenase/arogenate dehydrogenase family protein [Bryobacteraceae bacterium]|nr:prephenate dehydrogenase/arogenate dehydrogenase family protein [Bryobacteraceae bacterium]
MQTVAIVGVGLIGGSFGLALRQAGFAGRIIGVSSEKTIQAALTAGAIDSSAPLEEAAEQADLIYLSQTISGILATIPRLEHCVRPGALVTDAGSTKTAIVNTAKTFLLRCTFLGGHPLAGKERRGVEAADPELFRNRTYALTPLQEPDLNAPHVLEFMEWLRRLGARTLVTSPDDHDRQVALTSHLPQLLSTALASYLGEKEATPQIWGPALVDSTRLAMSSFEIWHDILVTNQHWIESALTAYISELEGVRERIGTLAMQSFFERAAETARRFRETA